MATWATRPAGLPWQRLQVPDVRAPTETEKTTDTNKVDAAMSVAGVSDGTNLFLGVVVEDDARAETKNMQLPLPRDDNLQVLILSPKGPGVKFQINRHHVLTQTPDGPVIAGRQFVSQDAGTKAALSEWEKGSRLEVEVPLKLIGPSASDKLQVGFNLVLTDVDAGEPSPQILNWAAYAPVGGTATGKLVFVNVGQ